MPGGVYNPTSGKILYAPTGRPAHSCATEPPEQCGNSIQCFVGGVPFFLFNRWLLRFQSMISTPLCCGPLPPVGGVRSWSNIGIEPYLNHQFCVTVNCGGAPQVPRAQGGFTQTLYAQGDCTGTPPLPITFQGKWITPGMVFSVVNPGGGQPFQFKAHVFLTIENEARNAGLVMFTSQATQLQRINGRFQGTIVNSGSPDICPIGSLGGSVFVQECCPGNVAREAPLQGFGPEDFA